MTPNEIADIESDSAWDIEKDARNIHEYENASRMTKMSDTFVISMHRHLGDGMSAHYTSEQLITMLLQRGSIMTVTAIKAL